MEEILTRLAFISPITGLVFFALHKSVPLLEAHLTELRTIEQAHKNSYAEALMRGTDALANNTTVMKENNIILAKLEATFHRAEKHHETVQSVLQNIILEMAELKSENRHLVEKINILFSRDVEGRE